MAKLTPVIWSPIKHQFIKMGAGDGGIIIAAADMIVNNIGGQYNEPIATYDNIAVYTSSRGTISAKFEEMRAGLYSVTLRTNWNSNSVDCTELYNNNAILYDVKVYTVNSTGAKATDIASSVVRFKDFDQFGGNKWGSIYGTLGFIFNYKNNTNETENIVIEICVNNDYGYHVGIDYINISSVLAGIYTLPVIQY